MRLSAVLFSFLILMSCAPAVAQTPAVDMSEKSPCERLLLARPDVNEAQAEVLCSLLPAVSLRCAMDLVDQGLAPNLIRAARMCSVNSGS